MVQSGVPLLGSPLFMKLPMLPAWLKAGGKGSRYEETWGPVPEGGGPGGAAGGPARPGDKPGGEGARGVGKRSFPNPCCVPACADFFVSAPPSQGNKSGGREPLFPTAPLGQRWPHPRRRKARPRRGYPAGQLGHRLGSRAPGRVSPGRTLPRRPPPKCYPETPLFGPCPHFGPLVGVSRTEPGVYTDWSGGFVHWHPGCISVGLFTDPSSAREARDFFPAVASTAALSWALSLHPQRSKQWTLSSRSWPSPVSSRATSITT
jgi:hypothetical protein